MSEQAAQLVASVEADNSKLNAGLASSSALLQSFASSMAGYMGAATAQVNALGAAMRQAGVSASTMGTLNKAAFQASTNAATLAHKSVLDNTAQQAAASKAAFTAQTQQASLGAQAAAQQAAAQKAAYAQQIQQGTLAAQAARASATQQAAAQKIVQQQLRETEAAQQKVIASYRMIGQAAKQAGREMTIAGLAGLAGMVGLMKIGGDLDATLLRATGNTTLAGKEIEEFNKSVLLLGANMGVSNAQIAEGMMHIIDLGYSVKDATLIQYEANKMAVASNASGAETANILASVMHQYGATADQARNYGNVLHAANIQGNTTLDQFNKTFGRAVTAARNYNVSLYDVAAAYGALTRNGFRAAEATTQVTGMLTKISHPSATAEKALEALSAASGIDLVGNFTVAGLASRGFSGVLEDLEKVAKKTHQSVAQVIGDVIPAQRGGIGLTALAGRGKADFDQIKGGLGKGDLVDAAYERAQASLNVQLTKFQNLIQVIGRDIEQILLPPLVKVLGWVEVGMKLFDQLSVPMKTTVVVTAALGIGALLAIGPLLSMAGTLLTVSAAAAAADVTVGALALPFVAVAAAIVLPIVAIGALALALYTNFGGIRDAAWKFVEDVAPPLYKIWLGLVSVVERCWDNIVGVVEGAMQALKGGLSAGFGLIAGIVVVALDVITGDWAGAWKAMLKYGGIVMQGIIDQMDGFCKVVLNIFAINDDFMLSAGLHLMQSLENGIYNGGVGVINAAKSVMNDLLAVVSKATGMKIDPIKMTTRQDVSYADNYDRAQSRHGIGAAGGGGKFDDTLAIVHMLQPIARAMAEGEAAMDNFEAMMAKSSKLLEDAGKNAGKAAGDGFGKGGKESKGKIDKTASDIAAAINAAKDKLFDLTHTDQQIKVKDSWKEYYDNLASGVSKLLAAKVLHSELGKIAGEAQKQIQDALAKTAEKAEAAAEKIAAANRKISDSLFKMTHTTVQNEKHDNLNQLQENFMSGADWDKSVALFKANDKKIDSDELQRKKDAAIKFMTPVLEAWNKFNTAADVAVGKVNANISGFYDKLTEKTQVAATKLLEITDPMAAKWQDFLIGFQDNLDKMALDKSAAGLDAYAAAVTGLGDAFQKIEHDDATANLLQKKKEQMQNFMDESKNILTEGYQSIYQHGILGFFNSVAGGFANMMQKIVSDYLANATMKGITGFLGQLFGAAVSIGSALSQLPTGSAGTDAGSSFSGGSNNGGFGGGTGGFNSGGIGSFSDGSGSGYGGGSGGFATSRSVHRNSSGNSGSGSVTNHAPVYVTMHINGVTDAATFNKNRNQIVDELQQEMSYQQARNRR